MDDTQLKVKLLNHCSFQVASYHKRFVRDMARIIDDPVYDITPRQRHFIDRLYYRYRRQVWYWIDALRMADAPIVIEPSPFVDESELSADILTEQLQRWDNVDSKLADTSILYGVKKPKQTRREREALTKLEKWNRNVRGKG